ncbi:hypothetical protein [Actinoplanes sp. NPDC049316]|uniref:hypothetical protein n=1 Tax=Actinoplanes sp. NPDC049316 TaxID=3154727 RepID=UPI003414D348
MSWKLFAVVLAVLAALTIAVGAFLGGSGTPGNPPQPPAAIVVTDGPGGTCVTCA